MKKIRLTEKELTNTIINSVQKILKESEENDREWAKYDLQHTMNNAIKHGLTDLDYPEEEYDDEDIYNQDYDDFDEYESESNIEPNNFFYYNDDDNLSVVDKGNSQNPNISADDIKFNGNKSHNDLSTSQLKQIAKDTSNSLKSKEEDLMYNRYGIEDKGDFLARDLWVQNGQTADDDDMYDDVFDGPRKNGVVPKGDYTKNSITGTLDENTNNKVRLTESQLYRVIKESVTTVLKEGDKRGMPICAHIDSNGDASQFMYDDYFGRNCIARDKNNPNVDRINNRSYEEVMVGDDDTIKKEIQDAIQRIAKKNRVSEKRVADMFKGHFNAYKDFFKYERMKGN